MDFDENLDKVAEAGVVQSSTGLVVFEIRYLYLSLECLKSERPPRM